MTVRRCARCLSSQKVHAAYWGEDLCSDCAVLAAERHDKFHTWPLMDPDYFTNGPVHVDR